MVPNLRANPNSKLKRNPKGNDRGGEGEAQNLQRWGKGLGGPIVQRRTRTQA